MENTSLNSNVLTIVELCDGLHISRKYAYKFIRDNKIKFMQIGRKFYLSRKSIEKLLSMED